MNAVACFAPIERSDAKVLILGSMPGAASLQQQQYYAHPRNSFWYIMSELLDVQAWESYAQKQAALIARHIALWDVLNSCIRPGSLDASIEEASIVVNDFAHFFNMHENITHVFFNGQKARKEYKTRVLPQLSASFDHLNYHVLPSTSPAMASLSKEQKLDRWRLLVKHI
ncbi:MAG: DNA-deoxyinosine glycosylase [Pseudomonadota bacterium]